MDIPSMDTVYQAINALYNNPNTSEKEKASLWLGEIQKSIHAWKIADELLQQKKDIHSCYFAAQTMRSKVQHSLSELPAEAYLSLRDSLVTHLERAAPDAASPILTQLALALADLALQLPAWRDCTTDLIKLFANKNDFALLEILTVLPQEVDSTSLKLGENRRAEIKADLRANASIITVFLKETITNIQNTHIALKIVKCMTSWIQVRAVVIQEIPQNAVIGFCLQVLRDHNSINTLHDAASDCICALLHCLEDNNNTEDIERLLFESLLGCEESYHMAVAHEEEEKAANYARVFTELAEAFLFKIITCSSTGTTHFSIRSLELVLVCVGHHDYEVAEITFNLWYRLSEEVYQRDYPPLTDTFKPYIERLIGALARHCQCEPDLSQLPEEGDDFYEFRYKVQNLIKDVVFIVGSSSVFRQMFATLTPDASWEQTEAALFVMQAVAKNLVPEEYEYVPKVVEAILSMPETAHLGVRHTCILLLGELCEWVERHPAALEPALRHLVRALAEPRLASPAAAALRAVCAASRAAAAQHVAPLLAAAAAAAELPPPASSTLMRAVASAIGALPPAELAPALRHAAAPQLEGLRELLRAPPPPPPAAAAWLDRLAALFRDVEIAPPASGTPHPALPALEDTWPVLRAAMERWAGDGRVVERLCRCVRFCLRCVGPAGAPLLPALSAALASLYEAREHSCVLYVASVAADELAGTEEGRGELLRLLEALAPRALRLLRAEGCRAHPDTVDDLYRLAIRYLQRVGRAFLTSPALADVATLACEAAALDHRDANASVMKFLYELARLARSQRGDRTEAAQAAMARHGPALTTALVSAAALHLHGYMLADVAEVLVEFVGYQRECREDWLAGAVRALPSTEDRAAAATDRQKFDFHQNVMRTEKVKEMTRLLKDFSRLYR